MDELRNILESKGVSKDSKILDICCGDGSLAHKITSFGFTNVKGVDRNLHQLKQHSNKSPIEFLQGDIKDLLQHFEADSVEVILCCRSLHFIDNVSIIKTLLSPSGCFILINYPIMELHFHDDDSNMLNQLFEDFYTKTFSEELSIYWNTSVRHSFSTYCDPTRPNKHFWTNENIETIFSEEETHISLLDIDAELRQANVVNHFIANHGSAVYQDKLDTFLSCVCKLLDYKLEDLLFQDEITVIKKQSYSYEIHMVL